MPEDVFDVLNIMKSGKWEIEKQQSGFRHSAASILSKVLYIPEFDLNSDKR